jgi:lysyl-tRNA synthetase class 2
VETPSNKDKGWRPSASFEVIQQRAECLARARRYFAENGALEVETPLLVSATIPDPNIPSFSTAVASPGEPSGYRSCRYLSTSPEFAMKRLLAAGSKPIYQICKAFRQGEQGRLHNPEFTLLEWYRPGFDHHQLMDEVATLVMCLAEGYRGFEVEERLTYGDCFQRYLEIDPFIADVSLLKACAEKQGIETNTGLTESDRDGWLDLLMSHCVQPHLGQNRLSFVYDYPASQAALAKIRPGSPPVAERFELFIDGVELANGFHELQDAAEQRARFKQELQSRQDGGLEDIAIDEYFLAALEEGLPECAGVAMGLDRLLLVLTGAGRLEDVISFSFERV